MKKFCLSLAAIFVAFLAFAALPAHASDSGEEKVVPVIQWQCSACGKEAFTFDPDDIGGKTKPDNKVVKYQQENWALLSDTGKPISKCSRSSDGAHSFDKKQTFNTSPSTIFQRREYYIVLKSGGGGIKAKVQNWRCGLCGVEGYCFLGDDLDQYKMENMFKSANVFNLRTGNRISDCNFKSIFFGDIKHHVMKEISSGNPSSINLGRDISRMWYSD